MTTPEAIMACGLLAFVLGLVWVINRPRTTRGDDKHIADLRKLVTELTALRDQLDGSTKDDREGTRL
ncbi:hypothetical protein [Micromonospora zamorensis]|uniref:hypothetical protein n=1 Tax=Micromonospora zamorensis TaxID=709883 RepID=UPI0037941D59